MDDGGEAIRIVDEPILILDNEETLSAPVEAENLLIPAKGNADGDD